VGPVGSPEMVSRADFHEMPMLSSFFPLSFKGGATWTQFDGLCGSCDREFGPDKIRGTVTQPFDSVFIVDAMGLCDLCDKVTPFKYRLHKDGITGVSPQTGEWSRWSFRDRSLWGKLLAWWRR